MDKEKKGRLTVMKKVTEIFDSCINGTIEQFTYADKELRQYVVYSYYDKDWNLLYIGRSMRYYDAHYFNSQRLEFFNKVEYVGFIFLGSEEEIKEAKKFYKENVEN